MVSKKYKVDFPLKSIGYSMRYKIELFQLFSDNCLTMAYYAPIIDLSINTTQETKTMNNISELRKALRKIGFNVKTKKMSYGTHATYFNLENKNELPTMFTKESIIFWKPLLDFIKNNDNELKQLKSVTGIYGLTK